MNKKGLGAEIWIVLVLIIVMGGAIFLYWAFSTTAPLLVGLTTQFTGQVKSNIDTNAPNSSLANATGTMVNAANGMLGMVEAFVYFALIGLFIGFLAICYYVRTYRWLSIVWMFLMVGLVLLSMVLSNSYQDARAGNADLNGFYTTWGTNDFLMENLAFVTGFFGFISGILLFGLAATADEEGGLQI